MNNFKETRNLILLFVVILGFLLYFGDLFGNRWLRVIENGASPFFMALIGIFLTSKNRNN
ncbi:hypothetical protein HO447_01000 [Streptococcus suis]|nr:hypothetical protein [Streptococcus suis]